MARPRLSYVAWKLVANKDDLERAESSGGVQIPQGIFDGIKKWRRMPVAWGDTPATADIVYVLLDRIKTPYALLDPMFKMCSKAEKIRPSELPKSLRDLFDRLVAIGHAEASPEIGGEA